MEDYLLTVYRGRIQKHKIVKETNTGWTVIANWSNKGTTEHLKRSDYKPIYGFCFNAKYTTKSLEEAVSICESFQESLKCYIRDSESDVMNKHKFKGD